SLEGRNTDGFGFLESLHAGAPGWKASDGPAVLVGAGRAARAVVVSPLGERSQLVVLVHRTRERAEALAKRLGGRIAVADWVSRETLLSEAALLVNATTQGMTGHPALDLDLDALPGGAVVTDIVYTPLETPLLAVAKARGHRTVDGLGMLLHQAVPGFAAWFGVTPTVTPQLRATIEATLDH